MKELADKYGIQYVAEHAKELNAACPVAQVNPEFSPEKIALLVEDNIANPDAGLLNKYLLVWECLACGLCRKVSNGLVDMSRFIREVRALDSFSPDSHCGLLSSVQQLNAVDTLKPRRTDWIDKSLKVDFKSGKYLYWVGGAPFFDVALPEMKSQALDSARAAIRLLNELRVKPVVLKDERFSGHDFLWTGNRDYFDDLVAQNIAAIEESEAETVIVSSPEDYYTLAMNYEELAGRLNFDVIHITEFVAENLDKLKFKEWKRKVAYHDPCRLGRGMGVYDAPRKILQAIPGVELVEMEHSRELAHCCGTSCWTNCNKYSKLMQINRLREAVDAGAETLITSCWECEIHFRCATRSEAWRQVDIDIQDIILLASSLLEG